MTPNKILLTLSPLFLSVSAISAQAALTAVDNGLGVYDSGLDATWTSDANLLGTMEGANPSLINTIVTEEASAIATAFGHTLTASDFGSNGRVNWWAALAFVDYLNAINYGNSSQWALPTIPDSNSSAVHNQTDSQMGELFYNELGGLYASSIPDSAWFSNEQARDYWFDKEYASIPGTAWVFDANFGLQAITAKTSLNYAWAISPGQLNAVPLPGAVWLFGTGMLGLLGLKRLGHAA
jgi:hypothetical protein